MQGGPGDVHLAGQFGAVLVVNVAWGLKCRDSF